MQVSEESARQPLPASERARQQPPVSPVPVPAEAVPASSPRPAAGTTGDAQPFSRGAKPEKCSTRRTYCCVSANGGTPL
ncbi:MAG: hypothetical protein AW07_00816 [Candidatus Accumulibacter sp. SK-11]|nr:MAG: hypothetical protein AW07_00816 [Candidatus Accumulibacter sp. SK-11]